MSSERWQRIQELFEAALEIPPEERAELVAAECEGDDSMRDEVLAMLAHDVDTDSLLDRDPAELLDDRIEPGTRLGAYEIEGVIGEGGMGRVFSARRADGQFDKRVAIKVVRGGLVDDNLRRRFETERTILASLDHPNIATLLDSGLTEAGQPYLVMEYVDGEPIDAYCKRRGLSITDRLRLLVDVCRAVHHAHRNLVVHRDLKPENILVTEDGRVKLLDFGIAKLVDPSARSQQRTQTAHRLMTPEYAAPEQIMGHEPTTSTDVYALGVVLYELLTGQRPHPMEGRSAIEWHRDVCERDPEDPARLNRGIPGDVARICLFALRKEPGRRYASADQLAADLERFLSHKPVAARADTAIYRMGKFVRRHRVAVAAAAIATVALAAVVAVYTVRLSSARDRARAQARNADQIANFLVSLYAESDPSTRRGRALSIKSLLDAGRKRIETELASQPGARAKLWFVLGSTYANASYYKEAQQCLERALALQRELLPADHPRIARTLLRLTASLRELGSYERAESIAREAVAMQTRLVGDNGAELAAPLLELGQVLHERDDTAEAARLFERALRIQRATNAQPTEIASSLTNLSLVARGDGRYADTERYQRRALAIYEKAYGEAHPSTAAAVHDLADAIRKQGRLDEAEPLYRRALATRMNLFGERHADVAHSLNHLGRLLSAKGKLSEAEKHLRRAFAIRSAIYGEEHPAVAASRSALAGVLLDGGKLRDAKKLYQISLAMLRKSVGDRHVYIAGATSAVARAHKELGETEKAITMYRRAVGLLRELRGSNHVSLVSPLFGLGTLMCKRDRSRGRALLNEALTLGRKSLAADHPRVAEVERALAACR